MRIGVPREVKNSEFRVAMTPAGVHQLSDAGHEVLVETGAGAGCRLPDREFEAAGAKIVFDADELWGHSELVVKVKEPVAEEYQRLRPDLVLFAFLHLAADRPLTERLIAAGTTSIAYETVRRQDGALPLLAPMSEIAGRLAPQVGAHHLLRSEGGRGILLSGVPGVTNGRVVILGGGVSGMHAASIAVGLRADVTVLDVSQPALDRIDAQFGGRVKTLASNALTIAAEVVEADLVIGAVLVPGARAPKLVSNDLVSQMREGSVLIDIAVDQGGCFEDSHPTTHDDPTFVVHRCVFYCVANMPGAVPRTSTYALTNVTLPYISALANRGWQVALRADGGLREGLTTSAGMLVSDPVAGAHGLPSATPDALTS